MKQIYIGDDGKHYVKRKTDYTFDISRSSLLAYAGLLLIVLDAIFFYFFWSAK